MLLRKVWEGVPVSGGFKGVSHVDTYTTLGSKEAVLRSLSFATPCGVVVPFRGRGNKVRVVPLYTSTKVVTNSSRRFSCRMGRNTSLRILSRSFRGVRGVSRNSTTQAVRIRMSGGTALCCCPRPIVPFTRSTFSDGVAVRLRSRASHLFLLRVVSYNQGTRSRHFRCHEFSSGILLCEKSGLVCHSGAHCRPSGVPVRKVKVCRNCARVTGLFLSGVYDESNRGYDRRSKAMGSTSSTVGLRLRRGV